jgi:hypothetical protein
LSVVNVVCQVEVSATSWSLVQRSPVVRRCVWSSKPREWGGYDPRWVAAPQQKTYITRQAMHERNVEVRSSKHRCKGKAISILSVCLYPACNVYVQYHHL